jgi:hypothetical protein
MEYLEGMRDRVDPARYSELVTLVREQGDTPECSDFIQFLSNLEHPLQGINNNDELLGLFERYKQWRMLRDVLNEVQTRVSELLADRGNQEPYFRELASAIDEQWNMVYAGAYHENRLNNEELTQLISALQVIRTLLELNWADRAPCLYLLNNTEFDEHILVRGNHILHALLERFQNRVDEEHESPRWLELLYNRDGEFRMNQLARIDRHLRELQGAGTVLDIVDTRRRVIPPHAARHFLAATSDKCGITLEDMSLIPEEKRAVLTCGHTFRKSCIKKWLKENGKCPNCNKIAEINPAKGTTSRLTHIPPGGIARALVERQRQKGKEFNEVVVLNCGHVFEKSEIDRRVAKTCPKCGAEIRQITKFDGGSRKYKKNSRRKSKKSIKRKKTIKRR